MRAIIALILPSLVLLMSVLPTSAAGAKTLAERLGYEATDRLVIIHGDDMGMCHSANRATEAVLEYGLVGAASIMMPCPAAEEAVAYGQTHPQADLGLHLTFTAEWKDYRWGPLAPRAEVPDLLDPDGFLWHGTEQVAMKATPAEIEREARAQIERALALGMHPTHFDTHMGVMFARTDYADVYARLAIEYHTPCMMFEPTERVLAGAKAEGIPYPQDAVKRLKAAGFPLIDNFVFGGPGNGTEGYRQRWYVRQLRALPPGVSILIIHAGFADEELKGITGSAPQRDHDRRLFTSPEMRRTLERLGIKPIGWREIAALVPGREG